MSFADDLMKDLEDDEDDYIDHQNDDVDNEDITSYNNLSISKVVEFRQDKNLIGLLNQVELYSNQPERTITGNLQSDPEYNLIINANNLISQIDEKISTLHRIAIGIYENRFVNLAGILTDPILYMETVLRLGNNINRMINSSLLQDILSIELLSNVLASAMHVTTEKLKEEDLNSLFEACHLGIEFHGINNRVNEYVERRVVVLAPNLTALVGPSTSSKLIGSAGGLENLINIPPCNVLLIGAPKKSMAGLINQRDNHQKGYIFHSGIVKSVPSDKNDKSKKKIANIVANKCGLAARIDFYGKCPSGSEGKELKMLIDKKISKFRELAPVKKVKALPVPLEVANKKRGGRRARKYKEQMGMTELRRNANRMSFGIADGDDYHVPHGNQSRKNNGHVRASVVDAKTNIKISKALNSKLQKVWGGATTMTSQVAGSFSTVAFSTCKQMENSKKSDGPKKYNYFQD